MELLRVVILQILIVCVFCVSSIKLDESYNSSELENDCVELCIEDDTCKSVFWSNTSECRFVKDKTPTKFVPGEFFYCKDCETTIPLVLQGEESGAIEIINVALNKPTESFPSSNNSSSMINDGSLSTWFSSETEVVGTPWVRIDLVERHLVAQITINVKSSIEHKRRGGSIKICLVDEVTTKCNENTEILKIVTHLPSTSSYFNVSGNVIMGRYIIVEKLNEGEILEINEIGIQAVVPVLSYVCERCNSKSNTVCELSEPICRCKADNYFPINGNALNGCRDPCDDFEGRESVCIPIDANSYSCQCKVGHVPLMNKPCFACIKWVDPKPTDPCILCNNKNNTLCDNSTRPSVCKCSSDKLVPVYINAIRNGCQEDPCADCKAQPKTVCNASTKPPVCECNEGNFVPINGTALKNGCREDHCADCNAQLNTVCETSKKPPVCKCNKDNFVPINDSAVKNGCRESCIGFVDRNTECIRGKFNDTCKCKSDFLPIVPNDPCAGCTNPCSSFISRNSKCVPTNAQNYTCKCIENHFPIFEQDCCFGCKNPCSSFESKNSVCAPIDASAYKCHCKQGYIPFFNNACVGCKDCSSFPGYKFYPNFGCLRVHSERRNWKVARIICMKEGGDLFTLGEELPILPADLQLYTKESDLPYNVYWIGVRRDGDGAYKRITLKLQQILSDDSKFWSSEFGEPDRVKEEKCVVYFNRNQLLYDFECDQPARFICQILQA